MKVLFFARVREALDCPSLELTWSHELGSLDALQAHLCATGGERWTEVLGEDNMIRAVNQAVVEGDCWKVTAPWRTGTKSPFSRR
jgi:molybdopterin converting factor small subunit